MKRHQMKPEWRPILELRSVKDKIGVPIDCDIAEPGELNIIADLVREDIIVWIDRAVLRHLVVIDERGVKPPRIGINADIYQITLKGIRLCDDNGIKRR